MIKLTVLYGQPKDEDAFESYYSQTHLPIAAKLPHTEKMELTKFLPTPEGAKPDFYRMAEIYYANADHLQQSLSSEEGKATADDLSNFATGGVKMLVGTTQ